MTLTPAQTKRLAAVTTLHSGKGQKGLEDACLMQCVDWVFRNKDHFTDTPKCASPVLTAFGIHLNDAAWPTDKDRTDALRPAIPLLIGTRTTDESVEQHRRYRLVDFAVREAAPYWFDYAYQQTKKKTYKEHAAAMRACAPVKDAATREAARVVAAANGLTDLCGLCGAADAAANAAIHLPILRRAAEVLIEACSIR